MKIDEKILLLKALADSSRLVIINSLMEKPQYVEELAERIDLAASTVSFHLKKLEEAHLVYKIKEQYYVIYHPNTGIFNSTLKEIISMEKYDNILQEERITKYKNKILKTFIKHNKLIKIPVQYKKRLVILEEICRQFQPGKIYRENEIDEILESYYEDFTSLRRYLIDHQFLSRDNENYILFRGALESSSDIFQNERNIKINKRKKERKKKEANMSNIDSETKRELKRQFKETEIPMGVFQIKNLKNGKIYLEPSTNLTARMNRRRAELKMGTPFALIKTGELQNDWNKYGEENFSFEIVDKLKIKEDEPLDPQKEVKTLFELWLDKLQPYGEKGYNEKK
jgi:predicted transcriptional regulator